MKHNFGMSGIDCKLGAELMGVALILISWEFILMLSAKLTTPREFVVGDTYY